MSLTPVGDYLRKRYPPNDGATHWFGQGDDPGCCAGGHAACTYDSGWREAMRSLAFDLGVLAKVHGHPLTFAAGLVAAADIARARAEESPS